ncbi:hypothetical protein MLD38_009573 [Melastoma candidum]|uniref:Uncharacterized protein n=1 Tax=Melastoma candidum TaxID=119954 RepID=A0ACB9RXM7_9MYRT|nr:hypothetical protein MLD38_009573 [Melastoma candidum]
MVSGVEAGDCAVVSRVRPVLKREFGFALLPHSEMSGSLGQTQDDDSGDDSEIMPGIGGLIRNGGKRLKMSSPDSEKAVGDVGGNVAVEGDVSEEEAKSDVVSGEDVASGCGDNEHAKEVLGEKSMVNVVLEGMEDYGVTEEVPGDAFGLMVDKDAKFRGSVSLEHRVVVLALDGAMGNGGNAALKEEEEAMLSTGLVDVPVIVGDVSPHKSVERLARSAPIQEEDEINVEIANGDSGKLALSGTPLKLEIKMYKKIELSRPFVSLKEFLESGLLEGYHVTYCRGLKGTRQKEKSLEGVIKGNGILCFCDKCKPVNNVVVPTVFELHAGSPNKRPPEYIYLDSGRTLRDVMNAVKNSSANTIEQAVRAVIGSDVLNSCSVCLSCRGRMTNVDSRGTKLLCSKCLDLKDTVNSHLKVMESSNRMPEHVELGATVTSHTKTAESTSPIEARPILKTLTKTAEITLPIKLGAVVKPFFQTAESTLPIVEKTEATYSCGPAKSRTTRSKIQGKLTRKDMSLHKHVFEEDVLPDGTEVAYFSRGQKMLVGYKKGSGIVCSCCDSEVSPSQFEAHAGWASRRKPYLHIYTSNGVSLHELSMNLNKRRKFSNSENDDVCSGCMNGGDLLCCDTCPKAHNSAGKNAGADPVKQVTKRCIRVIPTPEVEVGGCALCRGHGFSRSGFGPQTVIICDQCEKEFHVSCLRDQGMADLKELPEGDWFCGMDCDRINCTLKRLVAHGEEKLPDYLVDVLRKKRIEKDYRSSSDVEIRWRILNNKMDSSNESRQLLSHSIKIFHDRFAPIADTSAKRDLIPAMVYGKSYKGQEFSSMFCVILIVNHAVVSAGLLRMFSKKVAELPLVATVTDCQGQGYFQSLFRCIEGLLCRLDIKDLVLPAAEEAKSIWINRFGFGKIEEEEVMELRRNYPLMIFQGTTVLKKAVPAVSELSREVKP